jgi:CRP-like cAMP-binding protein
LDIPEDEDKERLRKFLEDTGVIKAIGMNQIFYDTDHALEWAEDTLIARELAESKLPSESMALQNIALFRELDAKQLAVVEKHLHPVSYKKGDFIFKEGEAGDKIYFILSGIVSVIANFTVNGRPHRFITFAEGLFFGDMAILEDRPRSASIQAETDTELLFMHKDDFQHLTETEPKIASRMLMAMAREMSYRLRLANAEVRALSD